VEKNQDPTQTILALAQRHRVSYQPTALDAWGEQITRLSGDDVSLDPNELLLLALERAGHIAGRDAVRLHAAYLHQTRR
jgi:hypothetical protein